MELVIWRAEVAAVHRPNFPRPARSAAGRAAAEAE